MNKDLGYEAHGVTQERLEEMIRMLQEAHAIIKPERNKVVYRSARKCWSDRFEKMGIPEMKPERQE